MESTVEKVKVFFNENNELRAVKIDIVEGIEKQGIFIYEIVPFEDNVLPEPGIYDKSEFDVVYVAADYIAPGQAIIPKTSRDQLWYKPKK